MMNDDARPDCPDELSYDGILNQSYHLWQPRQGYRFGTDAILLGSALELANGSRLAELGAGVGAATITALHRLPDCHITAIEKDPLSAKLLRHNLRAQGFDGAVRVSEADIFALPTLLHNSFDQVFTNPPFHDPHSTRARHGRRALAHQGEGAALADWVTTALTLLKPKGRLTLVSRADKLDDIIVTLAAHQAGDIAILPIYPYKSSPAIRVIVSARKQVASPVSLLDGVVLHHPDGATTQAVSQILKGESVQGLLADYIRKTPQAAPSAPSSQDRR